MKLPKQEDFAILLMGELTKNYGQRLVPLSKISQTHGVSLLFLKKIVRSLKAAGLVQSKEGIAGGYSLLKDPHAVSVWDIIQAVGDANSVVSQKIGQPEFCPVYSQCLPQTIRKTVFQALASSLSAVTLNDLVSGEVRNEKKNKLK